MFWAGYRAIEFGEQPGALSFIAAMAFAYYDPAKRLANAQIPLVANPIGVKMMSDLPTPPTMNSNPDGPPLAVTRARWH
jgi:hypothetical protein